MRLSTEQDRDDSRAADLLHAAFDAGVTFLDTADAYCLNDTDTGHNEKLITRALESWKGDGSRVVIATKGGLTRPRGGWVPDGRARHLQAACEASSRALGVGRIHLYQLHAPDPRTPLSTSVRALAALKEQGLVEQIGLCNVNVGQIEEARRITEIATVQVELSPSYEHNVLNGVVQHCIAHGIRLIAYRPLGGTRNHRRLASDPVLRDVAERHGATTSEIALAWLEDLSDAIIVIPGPTRLETVRSRVRSRDIALTDEDRARLDAQFPLGPLVRTASRLVRSGESDQTAPALRRSAGASAEAEDSPRRLSSRSGGFLDSTVRRRDGEVVLVMGIPAAGKSSIAREFVEQGYARLNRDEAGGSLRGLLPDLERLVAEGTTRIVLDNTYVSRASRALVVRAAARLGLPVRCVFLSTSIEAAQVNAASRMVAKYGRLLDPDEMRTLRTHDINAFQPGVQFRHQRELEPPDASEGFSQIETRTFTRIHDTAMTNKALIIWCDDVLLSSRSGARVPSSPDDVAIVEERAQKLRRYHQDGWRLLGLAWRPEIADQALTHEQVDATFARMQQLLGLSIEMLYCPHSAGPPVCWCRKPLPGLGVVFVQRHRLDPSRCIYVGTGPQDPGFARRLGFQCRDAGDFFAAGALRPEGPALLT
jgi:aryl-alcohol dehydrogenase-like predicted oxidoreductase/histidinol phosphatase-like enzyme/predicted kinase